MRRLKMIADRSMDSMYLLPYFQAVSDDLPLENSLEKMEIALKQYVEN